VASIGLVSPGAATDGVDLSFLEKNWRLLVIALWKVITFFVAPTSFFLNSATKNNFIRVSPLVWCHLYVLPPVTPLNQSVLWNVDPEGARASLEVLYTGFARAFSTKELALLVFSAIVSMVDSWMVHCCGCCATGLLVDVSASSLACSWPCSLSSDSAATGRCECESSCTETTARASQVSM